MKYILLNLLNIKRHVSKRSQIKLPKNAKICSSENVILKRKCGCSLLNRVNDFFGNNHEEKKLNKSL